MVSKMLVLGHQGKQGKDRQVLLLLVQLRNWCYLLWLGASCVEAHSPTRPEARFQAWTRTDRHFTWFHATVLLKDLEQANLNHQLDLHLESTSGIEFAWSVMKVERSPLRKRGKYKINDKAHSSRSIHLISQVNMDSPKFYGRFWNPSCSVFNGETNPF